jgi:hypothetical protein
MFVRDPGNNETAFPALLEFNFGKNAVVIEAMLKKFPPPTASGGKWTTEKQRIYSFVQTTVFTCNVRYMTEAYKGKTFNVQYARGSGGHGSDVTSTFYNGDGLLSMFDRGSKGFAGQYQSYLVSHARSGDVNKFRINGTIEWPHAELGPSLSKVLNATNTGFELIADDKNTADDCDAWRDAMAALTAGGGISYS